MLDERELTVGFEPQSGTPLLRDRCHACGAVLPPAGQDAPGMVLRATVPQPIAAALRSTHLLSARERTVFHLLGVGYDNRSIARELGVSERTVKRHVTVILAKLRLESRLQAGLTALIISSFFPHGTA
jgi:DNA-binding NarL/FixJ family response regulator